MSVMMPTRATNQVLLFALLISLSAFLPGKSRADTLDVLLDQATLMTLPDKVATIVVGNPMIADIAVQSGGLVVVTGKGFGSTNLIALDRAGKTLMERTIVVKGASGTDTVQVYRGLQRETYSCTPNCERRITLGDSADYFAAAAAQAEARSGAAAGSASAGGAKAPAR